LSPVVLRRTIAGSVFVEPLSGDGVLVSYLEVGYGPVNGRFGDGYSVVVVVGGGGDEGSIVVDIDGVGVAFFGGI